jgi:hypothetical protein
MRLDQLEAEFQRLGIDYREPGFYDTPAFLAVERTETSEESEVDSMLDSAQHLLDMLSPFHLRSGRFRLEAKVLFYAFLDRPISHGSVLDDSRPCGMPQFCQLRFHVPD